LLSVRTSEWISPPETFVAIALSAPLDIVLIAAVTIIIDETI
jgi:hypothetical protein